MSHVILNIVKNLANISCKILSQDPSVATLCQDDTFANIWGQLIFACLETATLFPKGKPRNAVLQGFALS